MLLVDADIIYLPSAPVLSLAIDTGTSDSDGLTNNATINVTGLESGATWDYQVDGTAGSWITGSGSSFTATSGTHSYFVRQTVDGKTGPVSAAVMYTLDTSAPTAPTITTPIATDNAVSAAEATAGVTIAGTAEANSSVILTLYQVTKTVTADASGVWSATFNATDWGRIGRGTRIA